MNTPIPSLRERYPLQQALAYGRSPIRFIEDKIIEQGDCFSIPFGGRRLVIINDPEYIQHVFQGNHRNYIKAKSYRKLRLLLGQGLFTSEGDHWLKQRRMIQPSFRQHELSHFIDIMDQEAAQLAHRWAYFYQDGRQFSLLEEMSETTLNIVCRSLLGQSIEKGGKVVNEELPFLLDFMIKRVLSPFNTPMWLPLPKNRAFFRSRDKIGQLIAKLIRQKEQEQETTADLLGLLLNMRDEESGSKLSHEQLLDEIMTFFLAGHETSAVALAWTIFLLNQNEEWMAKARTESSKLLNEGFTPESLGKNSPVLLQICQESLRLYPPAWTLAREAAGTDQIGPYQINKGDSLVVNSYCLHRSHKHWERPLAFDPSRFESSTVKERHKFAYIPFGGGPRLCIGQHFALFEMQIVLAHILAKFDISIAEQSQAFSCSLTLRPTSGMLATASPI